MIEELMLRYSFISLWLVFLGFRGYYGRKARPPHVKRTREERWAEQTKFESKWLVLLRVIVFFATVVFVFLWSLLSILLPPWTQLIVPSWIRWLGLVIGILMLPAIIWVGVHLGRQVSGALEIKTDHQLVTSGPYKYIRHPMYLVYLIFNLSMLLICVNLILIVLIIVGVILVIPRMQIEEKMMIKQFGNEYREYIQQTGRLLPKFRQPKKKDTSSKIENQS